MVWKMKSPLRWCVRSNRLQYCVDSTLFCVNWFTVHRRGWSMCQAGFSQPLNMARYEPEICFDTRNVSHIHIAHCPSLKVSNHIQVRWLSGKGSYPEAKEIYSPYPTESRHASFFLQLCMVTKGWSPKTELSRPASGHFMWDLVCEVHAWRLNKTWCFPHAFSKITAWRLHFIAVWPKSHFIIVFLHIPSTISRAYHSLQGLLLWKLRAPRQFLLTQVNKVLIEATREQKTCMSSFSDHLFSDSLDLYPGAAVCSSSTGFAFCPFQHVQLFILSYSSILRLEALTSVQLWLINRTVRCCTLLTDQK